MINQAVIAKPNTPLLNVELTKAFVNEILYACRKVDSIPVLKVIHKFNLQNHKEIEEFNKGAYRILDFWKNKQQKIIITKITRHDSKCIACAYGKTVKVFSMIYHQYSHGSDGPSIIYNKEFAINLDIQNDMLMDFAWCNAFLDKEEVEELNN